MTIDPQAVRTALKAYTVMAVTAGVALFVLIVEIVLHHALGQDNAFIQLWPPVHGFIYMAYVLTIINLGFKLRWSMIRILLHMLTGFIPVLPFIAERRVTAEVEGLLAAADESAAAAG